MRLIAQGCRAQGSGAQGFRPQGKRRSSGLAFGLAFVAAALLIEQGYAADRPSPAPSREPQTQALSQLLPRHIVVSLADRKLALIEDRRVVKIYPVAVGKRSTPSPTGEFKIANRIPAPTYYHSGQVVPPGKANPLGTRWIGLSHKGYGIHGTNAPNSIGRAASHGCIRMRRSDVEELFQLVRVGDVVEIKADSRAKAWARAVVPVPSGANPPGPAVKASTQSVARPAPPAGPVMARE